MKRARSCEPAFTGAVKQTSFDRSRTLGVILNEGRILRQGNLNPEVQIYRYVTEESFDAYMWQALETKARFIHQVMRGETSVRSAEDLDSGALTYAEIKAIASGNPLVIEKAAIDAEVVAWLHTAYDLDA